MARIALFDARARRRLGAGAGVAALNTTLAQLGHELLRGKEAPWMHERFGCDGQQQLNRTYALAPLPSAAELARSVVSSTLGSERRVEHTCSLPSRSVSDDLSECTRWLSIISDSF
jgi:hypothetical protein